MDDLYGHATEAARQPTTAIVRQIRSNGHERPPDPVQISQIKK
jgi:hypothetical protein